MNTVNASNRFSGFQLKLGRSPKVIPPLITDNLPNYLRNTDEAAVVDAIISQVAADVAEAKDNLLAAKVAQAHTANTSRGREVVYMIGERVMLSMFNHRRDYKRKGEHRAAKFMPKWDRPYFIEKTHPETSNYTLIMPNAPLKFSTFHASQLKLHKQTMMCCFL